MPFDNKAAENFIGSAARSLDRRRYSMLFADGSVEPVIEAPRGYRSPDGGFGHGLELCNLLSLSEHRAKEEVA